MTDARPPSAERPPKPPVRRCVVSVDGVRCPEQPRYPGRDESSFCVIHDDPDNAETQAWQRALAAFGSVMQAKAWPDPAPHPGENHEFRTTCLRCGEPGYLFVGYHSPGEGFTWTGTPKEDRTK